MLIVNPVNGKVLRKERYSTYITRRLSELDIPASYKCEQFSQPTKEKWARLRGEDGDVQEQVLMRYKTLFVERDELWHKRDFKKTQEDEETMTQIKNMQSRPYLFCYR